MIKETGTFFSKWFFRSWSDESYTWLSFFWNLNNNAPQLWIYYNNSWLKFKPHQIFNIEELILLLKFLNKFNGIYSYKNLSISCDYNIIIKNNNKSYSFKLYKEELKLFRNYIEYSINYIKKHILIKRIDIININLSEKIKTFLNTDKTITISWYNDSIYNSNLIKDWLWKYSRLSIPTIEQEFHTQKKWIKTGYYFKFFSDNIINIRNPKEEISYEWEKYPIQVIVQQSNNDSMLLTLTEENLLELRAYIKLLLIDWKINETKNISINDTYSLTMKNSYNGQDYVNTDFIKKELYEKLIILDNDGNLEWIELLLKNKINNVSLIKNKFINKETIKSLSLKKQEFRNFSIANVSIEWVNEDSWLFQIWNIKWLKSCTINIIKWDISKWWFQFSSAPISEKELCLFEYKLNSCVDFLCDPYLTTLTSMYTNLETLRLLGFTGEELKCPDFRNIINWMISSLDDTQFLKSITVTGKQSEFNSSCFVPNIFRQLNSSIFVLKASIKWLQQERYPISIKVSIDWSKIIYFILSISEVIELYNKIKSWHTYSLLAKNWKFKKIFIESVWKDVRVSYNVSNSNIDIDSIKSEFIDLFDYTSFNKIINLLYEQINLDTKTLLYKAIIYSNNKIIYQ